MSVDCHTEREVQRRTFRLDLFKRRGVTGERAGLLVDRLTLRDRAFRDDRRMCIECKHLQADHSRFGRGCFQAQHGLLGPGVDRRLTPVYDVLQRCHRFEFVTPR